MAEKDEALKKAIQKAGSGEALADLLGITPQALSQWDRVPPLRVLEVERHTSVPRHELRPDLYPAPSQPEEAA